MVGRKNVVLFIDKMENIVQLYIEPYKKQLFIANAHLVLTSSEKIKESEYTDKVLEIINALNHRSTNDRRYLLLTCIDSRSVKSNLIVLCDKGDDVFKELETVCTVVETITQGKIKCVANVNPLHAFNECIGLSNMIDYLFSVFKRKKEENNLIPLHTISINPTYLPNSVEEFEYLSSIFSRGNISIGYLYSNPEIIVTLSDDHLFRHIAIVGSTGSGKSTTASIIAEKSAEKGYAVVIIDWHGEYEQLIQAKDLVIYANLFNGVILEPLNLEELIKREPLSFLEILESALELTPPQAHILEDAMNIVTRRSIFSSYCIDEIIDIIQNSSASARWFTESREALLRKLKPLSSSYLKISWNKLNKIVVEKGKVHIFDVSQIPNVRIKRILSSLLIRSITIKAQYNNIAKPLIIIVDEAHNILYPENPISSLIAEVRKWNIGFVVITQAPSMLSPVVLKNVNTKIVHTLKSAGDIKTVILAATLKKQHKKIISALKPGEALIVLPELIEPVLVKINRV